MLPSSSFCRCRAGATQMQLRWCAAAGGRLPSECCLACLPPQSSVALESRVSCLLLSLPAPHAHQRSAWQCDRRTAHPCILWALHIDAAAGSTCLQVPELADLGAALFDLLEALPQRVALLVSGDLAHTHSAVGATLCRQGAAAGSGGQWPARLAQRALPAWQAAARALSGFAGLEGLLGGALGAGWALWLLRGCSAV